ncbi:MAG TPA: plastocyanin/azurin family copper-binding protein [Gemmatimonadales bacterium]|nr:plastocyanin/azurin family copper-binding protein [Gemmatimonadales bacterium]
MRPTALAVALAIFALACSDNSNSVNNMCSASGASATIGATDGLVFSPTSATITHGQSVCWQNSGSVAHTVTSNDGTSFSSSLAAGQTFLHAFPTAGSFPYRCTIHAGMTGTITVN